MISRKRLVIFSCLLIILINGIGYAAKDIVWINNGSGWKVFDLPPGKWGYRYGPSIIINADNSIDMWTAAPGETGSEWDWIRYSRSIDGGHTWIPEKVALRPTPGSRDALSVCDPGVIRFGGYYYIGYTSTEHPQGMNNHLYVARGKSPTGPFDKWNGSGWGGKPQPIITYTGPSDKWGCGEPSFILDKKSGRLYIYYSHNDGVWQTHLAVCDKPFVDDWPAHLRKKGSVISHPSTDSIDVKYVDSLKRFVAIACKDRFTPNATISVWQSRDSVKWEPAQFKGSPVQSGAHNAGISGSEIGHIDASKKLFIGYSCQPDGYKWGNWPTYLDPVTIGIVEEDSD